MAKKKININGLRLSLRLHEKHLIEGMKEGAKAAALLLMRASQELCPVDSGDLKDSARTVITMETDKRVVVNVSYGTHYAVYVHEDLFVSHDTPNNPPTATAKFLEIPARTLQPTLKLIILDAVRRAPAKGG